MNLLPGTKFLFDEIVLYFAAADGEGRIALEFPIEGKDGLFSSTLPSGYFLEDVPVTPILLCIFGLL